MAAEESTVRKFCEEELSVAESKISGNERVTEILVRLRIYMVLSDDGLCYGT